MYRRYTLFLCHKLMKFQRLFEGNITWRNLWLYVVPSYKCLCYTHLSRDKMDKLTHVGFICETKILLLKRKKKKQDKNNERKTVHRISMWDVSCFYVTYFRCSQKLFHFFVVVSIAYIIEEVFSIVVVGIGYNCLGKKKMSCIYTIYEPITKIESLRKKSFFYWFIVNSIKLSNFVLWKLTPLNRFILFIAQLPFA